LSAGGSTRVFDWYAIVLSKPRTLRLMSKEAVRSCRRSADDPSRGAAQTHFATRNDRTLCLTCEDKARSQRLVRNMFDPANSLEQHEGNRDRYHSTRRHDHRSAKRGSLAVIRIRLAAPLSSLGWQTTST
jgi:hypothetical protein